MSRNIAPGLRPPSRQVPIFASRSRPPAGSSVIPTTPCPPVAVPAAPLKSATMGGATVPTNPKGFAVYSFARATMTKSDCNGACAPAWPPVKGPVTAGAGLTGKLGTIKRSDGSAQATYDGHPLYTFVKDTVPGTDTGNGVNAFGGLWHALTASGSAAPAPAPSGSSSRHHDAPPSHPPVPPPAAPPAPTANPTPQGNGGAPAPATNGAPPAGARHT